MPVTMNDVRAFLTQDEVNYAAARNLGPEALPLLNELVRGGDLNLASKAAYLASLIPGEQAEAVVHAAAASAEPVVRVAAAAGLRNMAPAAAERVFDKVKTDADVGVRKAALQSAAALRSPALGAKVDEMLTHEREPFLRDLAADVKRNLR
jgi:HEAT repeat protein